MLLVVQIQHCCLLLKGTISGFTSIKIKLYKYSSNVLSKKKNGLSSKFIGSFIKKAVCEYV